MASSPIVQRQEPRISANDLALYMVASDTARMGIVKRSKYPQQPPIIRYRDVRSPIVAFLSDPIRSVQPLTTAEDTFRQRAEDSSQSSLRQDDARQSIEVLHSLQRMQNQLSAYNFTSAPQDQGKLVLAGVSVSVRLDLFVHNSKRGIDQIGAAILRMTQDDADTDASKAKRREMGLYVAALAYIHLKRNFSHGIEVANRLCLSIDIRHGEVFSASTSNTRRTNDIESACRFIAAIWDQI